MDFESHTPEQGQEVATMVKNTLEQERPFLGGLSPGQLKLALAFMAVTTLAGSACSERETDQTKSPQVAAESGPRNPIPQARLEHRAAKQAARTKAYAAAAAEMGIPFDPNNFSYSDDNGIGHINGVELSREAMGGIYTHIGNAEREYQEQQRASGKGSSTNTLEGATPDQNSLNAY